MIARKESSLLFHRNCSRCFLPLVVAVCCIYAASGSSGPCYSYQGADVNCSLSQDESDDHLLLLQTTMSVHRHLHTAHRGGLKEVGKDILFITSERASTNVQGSDFSVRLAVTITALAATCICAGVLVFLASSSGIDDKVQGKEPGLDSSLTEAPEASGVPPSPLRNAVWQLLEARTDVGRTYQTIMVMLIFLTVASFVLDSLMDREYNVDRETGKYRGPEWNRRICDIYLIGSDELGGTCVFEIIIVAAFSADYCLRLWTAVEDPACDYSRMRYFFSFWSLVDILAIAPFYVEVVTPITDVPASQFIRVLRLLRMLSMDSNYEGAFTLFDDVLVANTKILGTAGFVGTVIWIICSGLYFLTERRNQQMIYCPRCPEVDVERCEIDTWGGVSCSKAGCDSECWNLFESIPSSMFFTVCNLFGEFVVFDRQSNWGKVVATLVAVFAVFVFAIPTGIIGNGFDNLLKERRKKASDAEEASNAEDIPHEPKLQAEAEPADTMRGQLYDFLNGRTRGGKFFEMFIAAMIILSTLSFFVQTCTDFMARNPSVSQLCKDFELFAVIVFTIEYVGRLYSIGEDPKYAGWPGLWSYMFTFLSLVDLLSILPYWYMLFFTEGEDSTTVMFVRAMRLVRLFKSEHYIEAFTIFDDVIYEQSDVLLMTGFAAFVMWIIFSALMYYTERDSPDDEIASYYRTIPDSMWITLLNLSGEVPLAYYSKFGKVMIGIIGIFAVGFCSIPIGILGAGFQDYVESHAKDTPDAPVPGDSLEEDAEVSARGPADDQDMHTQVDDFVEGRTYLGSLFEVLILVLIFSTILIAIIETVPGFQCDEIGEGKAAWCPLAGGFEAFATIMFTVEYALRFFAAESRVQFVFSFYSLVDLLAIVPFYVALLDPGGWVDERDGIFRMFRILRLIKLDKWVPSLTLIDDVFRLKRNMLIVTGIVAGILWIIFGALLYIIETKDTASVIDPMPLQGCSDNCTESVRYTNAFAAMPFTMIHLTGDYPIIEYNWYGRALCMVMVVIGVGVVSIPSGVIADGFVQVVHEKTKLGKTRRGSLLEYDISLAALADTPAPREFESDFLDSLQSDCNQFLNGVKTKKVRRTLLSWCFNRLVFALILLNTVAVLVYSIPDVNRAANSGVLRVLFSSFEGFTLAVFTVEYVLRIFSVIKDKEHLYSRWCYVTTFFGIVDLMAIVPSYVEMCIGSDDKDTAQIFLMLRLLRLFQFEHYVTAFSVLDNVFHHSAGMFIATGVMALVIWVASAALYYLFEYDNPNWCGEWEDDKCSDKWTADCKCKVREAFTSIPDCLYIVAINLGGEWAVVDFTFPGKLLCLFLCIMGIAIYALPVGTLFDSFGAVLEDGLDALNESDDSDD